MKKLILTCLALACIASSCQTFSGALPEAKVEPPEKAEIQIIAASWQTIYLRAYLATRATPNLTDSPVDGIFWCPTFEQLNLMDRYVRPRQHTEYVGEAWDCDDMAKEWETLTHLWASQEYLPGAEVALATFLCYVEIRAGAFDGRWSDEGKHALGLVCDNTGCWWFVDAQTNMHQKVEEAYFEGTIAVMRIVW